MGPLRQYRLQLETVRSTSAFQYPPCIPDLLPRFREIQHSTETIIGRGAYNSLRCRKSRISFHPSTYNAGYDSSNWPDDPWPVRHSVLYVIEIIRCFFVRLSLDDDPPVVCVLFKYLLYTKYTERSTNCAELHVTKIHFPPPEANKECVSLWAFVKFFRTPFK